MVFYRDPSNSCGWGLWTFTLVLAKPHGPRVSTRETTPALKLSSCWAPCATSEEKQSSQAAPSSRTCSRECCTLSTVIVLLWALLLCLALHQPEGSHGTFWCCHMCPTISHRPVTELDRVTASLPTPPKRCSKNYPKSQDVCWSSSKECRGCLRRQLSTFLFHCQKPIRHPQVSIKLG